MLRGRTLPLQEASMMHLVHLRFCSGTHEVHSKKVNLMSPRFWVTHGLPFLTERTQAEQHGTCGIQVTTYRTTSGLRMSIVTITRLGGL